MKRFIKEIRYIIEYILVRIFILIFQIIGFEKSTKLSIFLTKNIGKILSVHNLAKNNIKKSLKKLSDAEINNILDKMWDNLGKVITEYYFINKKSKNEFNKTITLDEKSKKNLQKLKRSKKGGILFSAHYGSWEVGARYFSMNDFKCKILYRPLNNKYVDKLLSLDQRSGMDMIGKGAAGSKEIMKCLKNNEFIIIMADQRVGDGIKVPFFGRKALTSPSFAKLSLRYNIPLIPVRIIREDNNKFNIEISDSITIPKDKELTMDKKIYKITREINKIIEKWIKQYPEQWFWVHNRWKK
ncbi:lysophospholipid acyltransferase family protein [Rickettsiales bacterium]|nr:lysophospholipid acyltransferase family protein [Rickettsiales bacterium]